MRLNSEYKEGTFANPDVNEDILECIVHFLKSSGSSHPHKIICHVKQEEDVPRDDIVKGLQK